MRTVFALGRIIPIALKLVDEWLKKLALPKLKKRLCANKPQRTEYRREIVFNDRADLGRDGKKRKR